MRDLITYKISSIPVALLLIFLTYICFSNVCVTGDFALQLSSLIQYLDGNIVNPNSYLVINQFNLAEQSPSYFVDYPAGALFFIKMLMLIGIGSTLAVKIVMGSAYLMGITACSLIVNELTSYKVNLKVLLAFSLPLGIFHHGLNPFIINTADLIAFGWITPIIYFIIKVIKRNMCISKRLDIIILLPFLLILLGTVCILKYSQYIYSLSFFIFVSLYIIISFKNQILHKIGLILTYSLLFLLPFVLLIYYQSNVLGMTLFDYTRGSNYVNQTSYVTTYYGANYLESNFGKLGLLSILGSPGWAAYANSISSSFCNSLISNFTLINSFCLNAHINTKVFITSLIGIIFFVPTVYVLLNHNKSKFGFSHYFLISMLLFPTMFLLYNSRKHGYNYLTSHEGRWALPFDIIFKVLTISLFLRSLVTYKHRIITSALFLAFIFFPFTYGLYGSVEFCGEHSYANRVNTLSYPNILSSSSVPNESESPYNIVNDTDSIIFIVGLRNAQEIKLFCHDQFGILFQKCISKYVHPDDFLNLPNSSFASKNPINIYIFLHKYFTNPEISTPDYSPSTTSNSLHFEPRIILPKVSNEIAESDNSRILLDAKSFFQNAHLKFKNSSSPIILTQKNDRFNWCHFVLAPID